jgi:hypothetical protein
MQCALCISGITFIVYAQSGKTGTHIILVNLWEEEEKTQRG